MPPSNPFQNLIVSFAQGERIFTEGEVGATMFIVHSGRARLFQSSRGANVEVAEMEKGDFFGEMSLLEGTPRQHSAEAIEAIELIEIDSTTFDRMIRGNIEIAVRLLRKLSGRLQKTEAMLAARAQSPENPRLQAQAAALAPVAAAESTVAMAAAPVAAAASTPARAASVAPANPPARQTPSSGAPGAAAGSRSSPPIAVLTSAARTAGAVSAQPGARSSAATSTGPRFVSEAGDVVFPIRAQEATLGRYDPVTETQPEVDLTLVDIKRSVSRRHAKIYAKDGGFYLTEEVGALNGTFINGSKLVTGKPAPVRDGDQISLGTVHLVFKS